MTPAASWPIVEPGLWVRLPERASIAGRQALFLDRDGVLVEDVGYLADPASVRLVPGAAALVAAANRRRIPVIVVTNQSGIARGRYGWQDFAAVDAEVARYLALAGATLDGVIACPFHPDFTPGYGPEHARFRKPGPGMIELGCRQLQLDGAASWMVGDNPRDCAAARAAGLAGAILLGRAAAGEAAEADCTPAGREGGRPFRLVRCPDLRAAIENLNEVLFGGRPGAGGP